MDGALYLPVKESVGFFLYTMVELSVLFVGISFLVGLINEFLPQEKVKHWLSGGNGRGYLIGSLLGGLTPFCSCSTIPLVVGLLRAGAGFGPTMAFLFTSPLVNPIIVPLFFTMLGYEVTMVYVAVAIGMTIVISFMLDKFGFSRYVVQDIVLGTRTQGQSGSNGVSLASAPVCCDKGPVPLTVAQMQPVIMCCDGFSTTSAAAISSPLPMYSKETPNRWKRIFKDACRQFKKLLPFVILGVAIGSVIHGFLPADLVVRIAGADNPLAVPISAIVGIPLYIRVSTMIPIAASLSAKGMSIGAIIALIIGGAGASLPEVAMLKGLFKLPLLVAFLASVMIMAVSAGYIVNLLMLS